MVSARVEERINWQLEDGRQIEETDIKNHNKNIIDLIEVGDYVNGYYVGLIDVDNFDEEATNKKYLLCGGTAIFEEDIKSIVTKEQYKSIEYIL